MLAETLKELEQEIAKYKITPLKPLKGDVWLWVSMLQKSIRRGEVLNAQRAATSLLYYDKKRFWNRLHIIALEDVGVASPEVITKVLAATVSSAWRKQVGEVAVGLYLVKILCGATKIRLGDSTFILAERSKEYTELRYSFSLASDKTLIFYISDKNRPLVERLLATWYLFGTQKYRSDYIPPRIGSVEKGISALRMLDVPAELTEACIRAISLSPWPLSVFTPLIWQEVQKHETTSIKHKIPVSPDVNGLVHCSADMFTRIGKTCIRELKARTPELKLYTTQQLGLCIFYLEGGKIDKELSAPALDEITKAGEIVDLESSGLTQPDYKKLKSSLIKNMGKLTIIRQQLLTKYIKGASHE